MNKVVVIGAGIAGLAAASVLAKAGMSVTVLEKNDKPGGRINFFKAKGYTFDMGPSWYWMPEVFENFYKRFGYNSSDFYQLKRLDPSYAVFFENSKIDVPASYEGLKNLFENLEKGSAERLDNFLEEAKYKYEVGMNEFVWKPGRSITEFASLKVLKSFFKLEMLSSMSKAVAKVVKHPQLKQILEFPVLFLGATPSDTPALYSLMNYADLRLGTWYPEGGMYQIANAFYKIAKEQGVQFKFNEPAQNFNYEGDKIVEVNTINSSYPCEYVVSNADYHHVDQVLLQNGKGQYDNNYWNSRSMAPSSLLVYLGIKKRLPGLKHHNLFFDADFDLHAEEIYKSPQWPSEPLFYVCCPSVSDASVAPDGCENLFLLMPLAPDLKDNEATNEKYCKLMLDRLERKLGYEFRNEIEYKRIFSVSDFKATYNAYKGNAYGLANTLKQTALLKPAMKSKKIHNLYYAGQLTTPGPGLPPSIISGQVAASELIKASL